MRRERYGVVTGVTVALALIAGLRVLLEPSIPLPDSNDLSRAQGDFLTQAAREPIEWQSQISTAFQTARNRARPVLMVVGTPWSRLGRMLDDQVFSSPDVARLIARDFIPLRIDGAENPRWLGAFLPVQRLRGGVLPAFQMWVLDPNGRVVHFIGAKPGSGIDANGMLSALSDARQDYERMALDDVPSQPYSMQSGDRAAIESGPLVGAPDFSEYADSLAAATDRVYGGMPREGVQIPVPLAWRYQLLVGRDGDLERSLGPVLNSPLLDWLHGGMYHLSETPDLRQIEFDKVAVVNAQMLDLISCLAATRRDLYEERIGRDLFDFLSVGMVEDDSVAGAVLGDEKPGGRSARASFSLRRLRENLSESDRDWARENLGLAVGDNPQMVPFPRAPEVLKDPRFEVVLGRLREVSPVPPRLVAPEHLDVNASVAASLVRAARLWNDPVRKRRAIQLMEQLEDFRWENGVTHSLGAERTEGTYLGDYLAYADAMLQDYLTNGRVVSFVEGRDMLERALEIFRGSQPGELLLTPVANSPLSPVDIDVPEIADGERESCSARAIRLLTTYGRLVGPTAQGRSFLREAGFIVARFSVLTSGADSTAAGYYAASADFNDPQWAFSVGPNAQSLADGLARLRPLRLVAAVSGPVRPDLRNRAPGLYVMTTAGPIGPLTVAQAAARLSRTLQVGVVPN